MLKIHKFQIYLREIFNLLLIYLVKTLIKLSKHIFKLFLSKMSLQLKSGSQNVKILERGIH